MTSEPTGVRTLEPGDAMRVLLDAERDARHVEPNEMRRILAGAPSHTGAALLSALHDLGYGIAPLGAPSGVGGEAGPFDIDAAGAAVAAAFGYEFDTDDTCYPRDYWRDIARKVIAGATGQRRCTQADQHEGDCTPPWTEAVREDAGEALRDARAKLTDQFNQVVADVGPTDLAAHMIGHTLHVFDALLGDADDSDFPPLPAPTSRVDAEREAWRDELGIMVTGANTDGPLWVPLAALGLVPKPAPAPVDVQEGENR